MKLIIIFSTLVLFVSCNSTDKANSENNQINQSDNSKETLDSVINFKIDTSTLEGKQEYILNRFTYIDPMRSPDFDTLIDLTYDGNKDYIIGYYGLSGTGIKNRIQVFLFSKKADNYILDSILSDIPNPTFYIDKRKITGFYIGNGGGGGGKLEWLNNQWINTKSFTVDKQDDGSAIWTITFPLKNKTIKTIKPFQMIPPEDILETNIKL